jgi:hypothetical protein
VFVVILQAPRGVDILEYWSPGVMADNANLSIVFPNTPVLQHSINQDMASHLHRISETNLEGILSQTEMKAR